MWASSSPIYEQTWRRQPGGGSSCALCCVIDVTIRGYPVVVCKMKESFQIDLMCVQRSVDCQKKTEATARRHARPDNGSMSMYSKYPCDCKILPTRITILRMKK